MRMMGRLKEGFMSDRGDSNARPLRPERSALPTALLSECICIMLCKDTLKKEIIVKRE